MLTLAFTATSGFNMGMRPAVSASRMSAPSMADFYDFSAKTLDGKDQSMSDYKGKPVLILNVASL
jgi:hypothetical protein